MKRLFALVWLWAAVALGQQQEPVRFFQFTDAHLFDDGYHLPREQAFTIGAENRRALRWAVEQMNAQGPVDFAVFTGDLGLQNVDYAQSKCAAIPVALEASGLPPFRLDNAVDELAAMLAGLKAPRVYFLAGNNDAIGERISDGGRFSCFMGLLQEKMKAKKGPEVYPLLTQNSFVVRGVRFAGMDTVSIKSKDNYGMACGISPEPVNCPTEQINLIGDLVDDSPQPVVLFMHTPDLIDPYRKKPVWDIDDKVRKGWEETACKAKVLGIFSGHFHDESHATYGGVDTALQMNPCVAAKTRIAPPLAEKNQLDGAQGRGFLRVRVSVSGIEDVAVDWYDMSAPMAPPK